MAVQARTKAPNFDASRYHGLSRDRLIRMYRTMYLLAGLTTAKFSSNNKTKSIFRLAVLGTKAFWRLPGKCCGRGTTGFFHTTETGRCA